MFKVASRVALFGAVLFCGAVVAAQAVAGLP